MINPQWLELPMSRTNFHGPKDVRAIEVRLYVGGTLSGLSLTLCVRVVGGSGETGWMRRLTRAVEVCATWLKYIV